MTTAELRAAAELVARVFHEDCNPPDLSECYCEPDNGWECSSCRTSVACYRLAEAYLAEHPELTPNPQLSGNSEGI